MYPEELRFTAEHEWVRSTDTGTVVFGITYTNTGSVNIGGIVLTDTYNTA